jgi:UDP-2,3-diacylglucosamine hydrolase
MTTAVPPPAAHPGAPTWPVLQAPPQWRCIDFISDLHLQASEPATFDAWQNYLQTTQADALFILGDLFEVWVGDDSVEDVTRKPDQANGFEARCAQALKSASQRLDVYFMHGNRDFLLGPAFAASCGMTLLNDPCVLEFGGQRWLLSHGDALCLADTDYMHFRTQVSSPEWQQAFLAKPLFERQAIARALRKQSEQRKRSTAIYADVDTQAACHWLNSAQASTLIHGHTHCPANHDLACGLDQVRRRIVLSDWDATATPPRMEVLRLHAEPRANGNLQRLAADLTA